MSKAHTITDPEEKNRSEKKRLLIYLSAGFVISIILIIMFSQAITLITARMTYDATMEVKKSMLRENVENLISYIDACSASYLEDNPDCSDEELEQAMTGIAYRKIYSETHIDGTYMWIQKVLDYNGGDGYAIRLIHPNLSDTEGSLLSTNTVNPSGVLAYKEELEGVKEHGSVFLTYDFKKLDSDEVTQKVTYSCLYRKFDWIVCMGVNIDDLDHYFQQAEENMRASKGLILSGISLTWLVMLYLMLRVYRRSSRKIFERRQKELRKKLDWDTVTGANSRSFGEKLLEHEFEASRKGGSTLLAMLDVDYFKVFNDSYGHDIGDRVLKEFVNAVRSCLSDTDSVIRWGGDEFIAVIHDAERDSISDLGTRITEAVRSISIPGMEGRRKITTSAGLAFIEESDTCIKDTLDRIDKAVYRAKDAGRDTFICA